MYSAGKEALEREKHRVTEDAPDINASVVALRKALPELQDSLNNVERLEQAYLLRKADLQSLSDAVGAIKTWVQGFESVINKFDSLANEQQALNRKKEKALDRLNSVLALYQG